MPRKDANAAPANAQAQQEAASDGIENYELPKSLVTRIAKSAIPDNAKLQKDTVLALVKGSTVFINFLAATAHDIASSRQHKSVSASDVLKALEAIQFGDMVDHLQEELKVYRELAKANKKGGGGAGGGASVSSRSKGKGKERASGDATSAADASVSVGAGVGASAAIANGTRNGAEADEDSEMVDARAASGDEGEEEEQDELDDINMDEEDELAEDVDEEVEGEGETEEGQTSKTS